MKYWNSLALSVGLLILGPSMELAAETKPDQPPKPPPVWEKILPGVVCNMFLDVTVDACRTDLVAGKPVDQPVSCATARIAEGESRPFGNLFPCTSARFKTAALAAQKAACPAKDGVPSLFVLCQPPIYSHVAGDDTHVPKPDQVGVHCNGDKAATLGIRQYYFCITQQVPAKVVDGAMVSCITEEGTDLVACGPDIAAGVFPSDMLFESYLTALSEEGLPSSDPTIDTVVQSTADEPVSSSDPVISEDPVILNETLATEETLTSYDASPPPVAQ